MALGITPFAHRSVLCGGKISLTRYDSSFESWPLMFETDTLKSDMLRLVFALIAISVLFGIACGMIYVRVSEAKLIALPDIGS